MHLIPIVPTPHFPSPYQPPTILPSFASTVALSDGAEIATFVYGDLASGSAPVLMLHGNGEDHTIFGPMIDAVVAEGRPVIAIDSRSQGKSSRGTAALTYEQLAEDAFAVMQVYGATAVHVLGFSDGAIEGLLLARDHSESVLSLTALGANLTPESIIEEEGWDLGGAFEANRQWYEYWTDEGNYDSSIDVSLLTPTPEEASKTAELLQLMLEEPHIEAESLAEIACPTTIMAGEFDCVMQEETTRIAASINGARLVIVPDAGHSLPKQVPDHVITHLFATISRCAL